MNYRLTHIVILLVLCVVGCDNAYFSGSTSFEGGIWRYDDARAFDFEIDDTTSAYNMVLVFDHQDVYPYQNLYVKTVTTLPDASTRDQTVSFELAGGAGFWIGDCTGSYCQAMIPIQENIHFTQIGKHTLALEQYTRMDSLYGINAITLRIEELKSD